MPRLNPSAVKTLSILQLNNWWIFILCLSTTFWFGEVLLFKCYILLWPKINFYFLLFIQAYIFKIIEVFHHINYLFSINEMGVLLRHLSFLYSWCSNHHHLYPFTLLNRHVYLVYTDNLNARILTLFIILKVWYANSFQKKIANFSNKNITLKVLCELTSKIIVYLFLDQLRQISMSDLVHCLNVFF